MDTEPLGVGVRLGSRDGAEQAALVQPVRRAVGRAVCCQGEVELLQEGAGCGGPGCEHHGAVTNLEAEIRVGDGLVGVPACRPGEIDKVAGVGQESVHRDPGALVGVLGRARWEQVQRASEVRRTAGEAPLGVL